MALTREQFRKLQVEWYERLKEHGFKDIEKIKGNELVLIEPLRDRLKNTDETAKSIIEEYFRFMTEMVNNQETFFKTEIDRFVLSRHVEGASIQQIAKDLSTNGTPRDRKTIRKIIRCYAVEWNTKSMDDQELPDDDIEIEVPPAEASYSIIISKSSMAGPSGSYIIIPEQYRNFVYSRWLRSLRFGNPLFKQADSDEYYKNYQAYIEKLLLKPDSQVRFAVLSDEHDVLLGFSVSREDVLDYIYVHQDFRRNGIALKLLPPKITTFTHFTLTGGSIWRKKYKDWIFNPFA